MHPSPSPSPPHPTPHPPITYVFLHRRFSCFSLHYYFDLLPSSQGSFGNSLFGGRDKVAYTLPFLDHTLWDFAGYVVVVYQASSRRWVFLYQTLDQKENGGGGPYAAKNIKQWFTENQAQKGPPGEVFSSFGNSIPTCLCCRQRVLTTRLFLYCLDINFILVKNVLCLFQYSFFTH